MISTSTSLSTRKHIYLAAAIVALVVAAVGVGSLEKQLPQAEESAIVELKSGDAYDLTASYVEKEINGVKHKMLAYNGSIPGPLLKISQGAEVTINFTNDTDMRTLLHSHGIRMNNAFDGSQATQEEMKPGETFAYKLKFPDAGMYWYHPHVREDYAQELGLYGNYLVAPSDPGYWNAVNREVPLFLDDVLIEDGQIRLSKTEADHTLMGRFGNVMLVNGEPDYRLDAKKGEILRFYITNAANTRTFNFAISGTKMKLVGGDGGASEREEWKDAVTIGPSERSVVEVLFEEEGSYTLQNKTPDKTYTLGTVSVAGGEASPSYAASFETLRANPAAVKSIDPYRQYFDRPIDKHLSLTIDMMGEMMGSSGGHTMPDGTMMGGAGMMGEIPEGGIEWEDFDMQMMNQMSNTGMVKWNIVDQDTGKKNMNIDWAFKKGEPVKIRIFNDPKSTHPMQHPIHLHGQRFLVVARDGVAQTNLVWKDTVLVKAGETVDIVLDTSNPGVWMAHCHIAEHLEDGMMMEFKVQ